MDAEPGLVLPVVKKFSADKDPRVRGMVERIISKYEADAGAVDVLRAALPTAKDVLPQSVPTQTGDWSEFHGHTAQSGGLLF